MHHDRNIFFELQALKRIIFFPILFEFQTFYDGIQMVSHFRMPQADMCSYAYAVRRTYLVCDNLILVHVLYRCSMQITTMLVFSIQVIECVGYIRMRIA